MMSNIPIGRDKPMRLILCLHVNCYMPEFLGLSYFNLGEAGRC
jgi:hypothetical protein